MKPEEKDGGKKPAPPKSSFQDMVDQGAIEKVDKTTPDESVYNLNLKAVEMLLASKKKKKSEPKPDPGGEKS